MVAHVVDHKVEWIAHDWAACVVKAERASYVYITAYMTSEQAGNHGRLATGCGLGETGTCYSGRSIDCSVVSKNFRQYDKNVRVDKSAPWSAHVAIAFDVVHKPSTNQTWQWVTLLPLVPQAPSHCREKWLERESAVPNNSPQEVVVASLLGPRITNAWQSERRTARSMDLEDSSRR